MGEQGGEEQACVRELKKEQRISGQGSLKKRISSSDSWGSMKGGAFKEERNITLKAKPFEVERGSLKDQSE